MEGGAWWAAVHGVAKSQTRLSSFPFPFRIAADGDCGREIQRCLLLGRKAMANPDRVLKLCLVLILDVALDSTRYSLLLLLSRFSRVRLCDPVDGSPPGSPVPGILQARTLEWVAISFSIA